MKKTGTILVFILTLLLLNIPSAFAEINDKGIKMWVDNTPYNLPIEYYIRITVSAFLGFLIGMDRIRKSKPIGLKTYTLITVGTCLITIISIVSVEYFAVQGVTMMDPMRLVAQSLPAVGFVGAGTIFMSKNKVKGLTSAAFVFFACIIGIGIGSGFYGITIFAFILMAIILKVSYKIEGKHDEEE